jgi:ribosomal subunit interface protein
MILWASQYRCIISPALRSRRKGRADSIREGAKRTTLKVVILRWLTLKEDIMNVGSIGTAIAVKSSTVDLSDTFRDHAKQGIIRATSKYFGQLTDASVHVSREGPLLRCTVNIHVGALSRMSAEAQHEDCYAAFKAALDKVEKQLRRAKRELREDKAIRTDKDMMLRDGLRAPPSA